MMVESFLMRRLTVLVGIGLVIAITLTACSTGERVDLGNESSHNLIAAIAGEPDQLGPHKTSAYFSFEVLENVYDTLVEPDENLEMRPALAESWEVSGDQPGTRRQSRFPSAAPDSSTASSASIPAYR